MFEMMLTGRMDAEVERVLRAYAEQEKRDAEARTPAASSDALPN